MVDYIFSTNNFKVTVADQNLSFSLCLTGVRGIQHTKIDKKDGMLM